VNEHVVLVYAARLNEASSHTVDAFDQRAGRRFPTGIYSCDREAVGYKIGQNLRAFGIDSILILF
jgi:hypothetical protein